MVWYQVLSLLAVFSNQAQAQCAPTTTVIVPGGVSATISAETYAQVQSLGSALVLECGTAYVTSSGVATLSGGTATLSGYTVWAQAEATITSRGRIAYARDASATVAPQATAIVDSAGGFNMDVGDGAFVSIAGRAGEAVMVQGGDITVTASDQVYVYATGTGARLFLTGLNAGGGVFAPGATAVAMVTGGGVDVADGGVATLLGEGAMMSMGEGGTGTIGGTSNYVYCYATGSADIRGGVSNSGDFGEGCSGTISGPGNHITLASRGSATIAAGATASVFSEGDVYVLSDADRINIDDGATATMMPGAVVTAGPQGVVRGSGPFVRIRSIAETDGSTIYTAEQTGTNVRRSLPAPTPRCSPWMTTCPDLQAGFKCVDTEVDIFNCGGCNFGRHSVRVGVDCTEGSDGNVACIAGQCVAL